MTSFLSYKCLKPKLRVLSAGHIVATVTLYKTDDNSFFTHDRYWYDTIMVASPVKH